MKKLIKAVEKTKSQLVAKVQRRGLYENFGQNEVKKLQEKFINISSYTDEMNKARELIQDFNEWCMTYNG